MQDEQKIYLLNSLISGCLSFTEVEKESAEIKSLENLKESFHKQAGCTWEDAVKNAPEHADLKVLKRFKVVKGKVPPQEFKVHCALSNHYVCQWGIMHNALVYSVADLSCECVASWLTCPNLILHRCFVRELLQRNLHHLLCNGHLLKWLQLKIKY